MLSNNGNYRASDAGAADLSTRKRALELEIAEVQARLSRLMTDVENANGAPLDLSNPDGEHVRIVQWLQGKLVALKEAVAATDTDAVAALAANAILSGHIVQGAPEVPAAPEGPGPRSMPGGPAATRTPQ